MKKLIIALLLSFVCLNDAIAQDSTRIQITSSFGIIKPMNSFGNSFSQSFSAASGLVYKIKEKVFLNGTFSVNMLKYNQSQLDPKSMYLITKTSSPFIQVGLSIGREFEIIEHKRLLFSPYIGAGAFRLSEPRLTRNANSNIVSQKYLQHYAPHVLIGQRLYFDTKTKLLRTVFVDTFYWRSNLNVQNSKAQAFSIMVGTKIGK